MHISPAETSGFFLTNTSLPRPPNTGVGTSVLINKNNILFAAVAAASLIPPSLSYARAPPRPPARARGPAAPQGVTDVPMTRSSVALPASAAAVGGNALGNASAQLAIAANDYQAFEALLTDVQSAYSQGDLAGMRSLATPEMLGYFSEELS